MAEARQDAGPVQGRGLVVVARQRFDRGDVDERADARARPDPRQDTADHRPRGILQPVVRRHPEQGERAVEDAVRPRREHELPEERHDERARQVRQEVEEAEEDLAAGNLAEHDRQQDRREESEQERDRHVLERPSPRRPESRIAGDADEIVEPRPCRRPDDAIVLERHHAAADERIVAPDENRQDRRRQEEPGRKRAAARPRGGGSEVWRGGCPRRRSFHLPDQPGCDQRAGEQRAEDDARVRAGRVDPATVAVEHEPAVGVLRDGRERRRVVEVLAGGGAEQQPEEASLHEVARRLPEADPRFRHRLDLAPLEVVVHLADAGGHFPEAVPVAQAAQVGRTAPLKPALVHVAADLLVRQFRRGERAEALPDPVALRLGPASDGFAHRVEMAVRLQHPHSALVGRGERHEADVHRRQVQRFGQAADKVLAAEDGHDFARLEEPSDLVCLRQVRKPPHNAPTDQVL